NSESACVVFLTDVSLRTDSPEHEQGPSAPFFNEVKSRYCRTNIDHIRDHGDDEGILNTGVLEVGSAKVEDEVHAYNRSESSPTTGSKPKGIATLTSQLLESLESDASPQAFAQGCPETF